jgi:hypothetical protein
VNLSPELRRQTQQDVDNALQQRRPSLDEPNTLRASPSFSRE